MLAGKASIRAAGHDRDYLPRPSQVIDFSQLEPRAMPPGVCLPSSISKAATCILQLVISYQKKCGATRSRFGLHQHEGNTMAASETKQCPYCKEKILSDAILCKHCRTKLLPDRPDHGGTCPYCKETIKEDAIKCKHCMSVLLDSKRGCSCSDKSPVALMRARPGFGNSPTGGSDCDARYEDCYLDCSFGYADGSLGQNICFRQCDRKAEICDLTGHWPRYAGFGMVRRRF